MSGVWFILCAYRYHTIYFSYTHTYIKMVISSTVPAYEIKAVEISTIEQDMGWDSQLNLKSLK